MNPPPDENRDATGSLPAQVLYLYQNGRLKEAEALCQKALVRPQPASDLLFLAGLIARDLGQWRIAADRLAQAVDAQPEDVQRQMALADVCLHLNMPAKAAAAYQQVLQMQPDHCGALVELGIVRHGQQAYAEAGALFARACRLAPDSVAAHFNMGLLMQDEGRFRQAIACFQRAFELDPDLVAALRLQAESHSRLGETGSAMAAFQQALNLAPDDGATYHSMGQAYQRQGDLAKAAAAYQQAIDRQSDMAPSWNNLGNVCKAQGDTQRAEACYRQAMALSPQRAEFVNNLAVLLKESERLFAALPLFQKAVQLAPGYVDAWINRGAAEMAAGQYAPAAESLKHALHLRPDDATANLYLGTVYSNQGRYGQARTHLNAAIRKNPEMAAACANLIPVLQQICDWAHLADVCLQMDRFNRKALAAGRSVAEPAFVSLTRTEDAAVNVNIARSWSRDLCRRIQSQARPPQWAAGKKRLTIGYLSGDFRNHPVAHQIRSLFALHDRSRFQIRAYSFGPNDNSDLRRQLETDCDHFSEIIALDLHSAAEQIRRDQVDILVDLMGHTQGHRMGICALRPAPIQVSFMGFLGSSGAAFIDYLIADRTVVPPSAAPDYSESLVWMPDCYQINDHRQPIAAESGNRENQGFAAHGFVFCCFNNQFKLTAAVFQDWMQILNAVPDSVLWLARGHRLALENLRRQAGICGVNPDRLVFAPKIALPEHLARLQLADLALDTTPYNGGATTSNALWAGVPVLSLKGARFVSRMSASALRAVGLPEMVVDTRRQYVQKAIALATHPQEMARLRQRLADNRLTAPLFDTPAYVRRLEYAYRQMADRARKGTPPASFAVPENV